MQDLDLCKQLLGLTDPWQVEAVEVDQPSNRLDIYIGFGVAGKRGLFGGGGQSRCPECHTELPRTGDFEAITLRHLPVAGLRTYLHVPPSGAVESDQIDCICMRDWMASTTTFTQAMEDHIVLALQHATTNQMAGKLAGVSSSEAREISEATGVVPSGQAAEAEPATAVEASESHEFAIEETGKVPGASHNGWQRLINGELSLQTDSVALRMLLQRIRSNLEKDPSQQTRLAGAQSLRQFFLKNQQLLHREIEMLTGEEPAFSGGEAASDAGSSGLPPESAAVWQQLINDELRLDTRVVGLQMMIQRVRQSIEQKPTEGNKLAGARILRQFFAKHQSRLANEISQLTGRPAQPAPSDAPAAATTDSAASAATDNKTLPSERDPVWQKLISGDITIDSDVISLKMLLQRVRQAVDRNRSESNRIAAAKILRQYFEKNRNKHAAEISQLQAGASAASAHAAVTVDSLPPEDHPNWQRLINGDIALHTDAVSLRMLLERIRQAIASKPTEANRLAGARMLRQYFVKNQHRHGNEIAALAGADSDVPAATQKGEDEHSSTVPGIEDPSWQRLINGELQIMTDAVGLRMMLERIRLSIEQNPSEASRLAGAKILRQYFIKHQNKHRAELEQLRAA